ncbi:hypothetical protein DUW70_11905 [Stenotrophomonas maltophilia]|nr:hypothetical protein DUW70_11905 [Stenotrophomonas maltophilia]
MAASVENSKRKPYNPYAFKSRLAIDWSRLPVSCCRIPNSSSGLYSEQPMILVQMGKDDWLRICITGSEYQRVECWKHRSCICVESEWTTDVKKQVRVLQLID